MNSTPKLIEHNVRSYVQVVLNKCNDNRVRIYSFVLNAIILVVFIGITVGVLWYCHSAKLSPKERLRKFRKDQEFVLQKIRQYQKDKDMQKEQFSRLLNRVSTSKPIIGGQIGSNYVSHEEEGDLNENFQYDHGGPFLSMIPDAPPAPHYRDALYREIIEQRDKIY